MTMLEIWLKQYHYYGHLKKKKLCTLSYFINFFHENSKLQVEKFLISQLDKASTTERWAIIKLFTGGLRIGVSEKNAKVSLSKFGNVNLDQIEKDLAWIFTTLC